MNLDHSTIADSIEPILLQTRGLVAAYLFGSAAHGRMHPDSDIDIALLLDEQDNSRLRKKLLDQLLPPISRVLRRDVHLLFLNDASYLVRSQIFKKGELIYVKDRHKLAEYRMISMALIAEFTPYLRMTQNGLKNRIRKSHGG